MKLHSTTGFGLIQVMVGVIVLGIVSMVFIRKALNRQDLGVALQLVSYRDQVLDYYTALASNRISWERTRGSTWSSIPNNTGIELKDADGTSRVPSAGLMLSWEDYVVSGNILPSTLTPCKPAAVSPAKYTDEDHFCLKAIKVTNEKLKISVEYRKKDHTQAEMETYLVKPVDRTVSFGSGGIVGLSCGDQAMTGLSFEDRSLSCSGPNHRLIKPEMCPPTYAGGQPAVQGFFRCSGANNVLLAKASLPSVSSGVAEITSRGVVIPISSANYIAVEPFNCGAGKATQGWNSDGTHAGCLEIKKGPEGIKGPKGFYGPVGDNGRRGPKGEKGPKGQDSIGPKGLEGGVGPSGANAYCCASCS